MKLFKIIFINLVVFAALLAGINWLCGGYLKSQDGQAGRELLPNYNSQKDRAKEIFRDYHQVRHQYEPFTGWKCLPYRGSSLTIANDGERKHKADSSQTSSRSVHFFGGSTMWGEGSDDQHTIPAIFSSLNEAYSVYNHGQLAYNTRQELDALITLYSLDKKPDVVIFYDGVNDAAFLCPKEIKTLPAHRLVPMYREKIDATKSEMLADLAGKVFLENTMKVINKHSRESGASNSPYDCVTNPAKAEAIAEIMMKNWEMAHELVTSRGGEFIAILQPAAYVSHPRTDHLKLDADLGNNFKAVYERLKTKIAQRQHPWVYDLTGEFDGKDYIFIDFCHVSPNGNEIIAREISSVMHNRFSTLAGNAKN
jgi:hypothetical protein